MKQSYTSVVIALTLLVGAPATLVSQGGGQPAVYETSQNGDEPRRGFAGSGRVQKEVMVTVLFAEVSQITVRALGVAWGQVQPKEGQELDLARAPRNGGSVSLLLRDAEAKKLQGWLDAAVIASAVCVSDIAGDFVVRLAVARLLWIRVRAAGRSLATLSASTVGLASEADEESCDS